MKRVIVRDQCNILSIGPLAIHVRVDHWVAINAGSVYQYLI